MSVMAIYRQLSCNNFFLAFSVRRSPLPLVLPGGERQQSASDDAKKHHILKITVNPVVPRFHGLNGHHRGMSQALISNFENGHQVDAVTLEAIDRALVKIAQARRVESFRLLSEVVAWSSSVLWSSFGRGWSPGGARLSSLPRSQSSRRSIGCLFRPRGKRERPDRERQSQTLLLLAR
jgi:hypothetical protein